MKRSSMPVDPALAGENRNRKAGRRTAVRILVYFVRDWVRAGLPKGERIENEKSLSRKLPSEALPGERRFERRPRWPATSLRRLRSDWMKNAGPSGVSRSSAACANWIPGRWRAFPGKRRD